MQQRSFFITAIIATLLTSWTISPTNAAQNIPPSHEVKIIGVGFSRTGTISLAKALTQVGFGPVYHGKDLWIARGGGGNNDPLWDMKLWLMAARTKDKTQRFKIIHQIVQGRQTVLDWPASWFWRDLVELYPNAKVILTIRTSANEWWDSASETILLFREFATSFSSASRAIWQGRGLIPTLGIYFWSKFDSTGQVYTLLARETFWKVGHIFDSNATMLAYENHIAAVKRALPPSRLLIFDVKQGWIPLCTFLNIRVPQPQLDFPRTNERQLIIDNLYSNATLGWYLASIVFGLPLVAIMIFGLACRVWWRRRWKIKKQ